MSTSSSKHIIFLQYVHNSTDERVAYHQADCLVKSGFSIEIYGSDQLNSHTTQENAIYIVDTPKAIWDLRRTKSKIIYDITEWYPSKKNLRTTHFKLSKAILLGLLNIWAGYRADAHIYGEEDKAKPFHILFPKKKSINLPYYPNIEYIPNTPPRDISTHCRILYAGPLTQEKGWFQVLETLQQTASILSNVHLELDVITQSTLPSIPETPSNLSIKSYNYMPFNQFCQALSNYDVFIDLRKIDSENTRCMPIKLFYYMAAGKVSIFSDLIAIQKGIPEIDTCAKLVKNTSEATQALVEYITNPVVYQTHCSKALKLSRTKYHWDTIQNRLIQLIHDL